MAKRRFIAPSRDEVDRRVFDHPIFAGFDAYRDWFASSGWPGIGRLNAAMPAADREALVAYLKSL